MFDSTGTSTGTGSMLELLGLTCEFGEKDMGIKSSFGSGKTTSENGSFDGTKLVFLKRKIVSWKITSREYMI